MDDRDHPDTNVFHLRRKDEPGEEERRRIASTIFAEEDEVGPFSRGNLVAPKPRPDDREEAGHGADAYFDQLQQERAAVRAAGSTRERDSETTAYFERLGRQSPAEMAQAVDTPPDEGALPGSARLSAEASSAGGRALTIRSRVHGLAAPARWSARRVRLLFSAQALRLGRPAALAVLAVAVIAGGAVATMIATASDQRSSASQLALQGRTHTARQHGPLARPVRPTMIAHAKVQRDRTVRRHPRARLARHVARSKTHVVLAADRTSGTATPTSTSASTTSDTGGSSAAAPQYSSPPASSGSSSSTSGGSGGGNRPAFGSNGVLGPGTSPNS